jgi:hypothetical protein
MWHIPIAGSTVHFPYVHMKISRAAVERVLGKTVSYAELIFVSMLYSIKHLDNHIPRISGGLMKPFPRCTGHQSTGLRKRTRLLVAVPIMALGVRYGGGVWDVIVASPSTTCREIEYPQ